MGLIHMPRKRVLRPRGGVLGVLATLPYPRPRASIVARLRPIAGDSPDEENPAHGGARKNPTGFAVGLAG